MPQQDPFASITEPIPSHGGDPFASIAESLPSAKAAYEPQGFLSSAADSSGLSSLGHAIMHPIQTLAPVAGLANDVLHGRPASDTNPLVQSIQGLARNSANEGQQAVSMAKQGSYGAALAHGALAIPGVGQTMQKAMDQTSGDTGSYGGNLKSLVTNPGAMGTLSGFSAGTVAPAMAEKAFMSIPFRSALAGDVSQPIKGGGISPLQRYNSAKALGVNLDAADATNSGVLRGVKKLNENSLLGSGSYDANHTANISALHGSTGDFLNSVYNGDRESGGAAIQTALKNNQAGLKNGATAGFQSLPQDNPLPGLEDVGKEAQNLGASNAAYQNLFPSLKPSKAMNVVGDVGGLGPQPPPPLKMSPFVDERGLPIPSARQIPARRPQSFAVGQQLRSDLLEFRRNNPDIVAGQGDAMVGKLAGGVDDALTAGSANLTPAQLQSFRDANAQWSDMKSTYDDPSSPLYHAVRSDTPSTLYGGNSLGPKTPEAVRNLLPRLDPAATGALQRGTIEGALKTTNDGLPNFKTFGTQLNRIPADYRSALFSPAQQETLGHIQNTSNALNVDANPSGSAKMGQKILEGSALATSPFHPVGALEPLMQYPVSKLMNSPKVVDWLMNQNKANSTSRISPIVPPIRSSRNRD
jgi:hypothetical protein